MNGSKKLQQLLAVLFIFTILLCSCRKAENTLSTKQEPSLPTIVIGSDNYPPFNYSGTDGRPTGIDVELATEAFHRMGYQAEFVTIDWENKKELLQDGSIDCAWGCFSMDGRMDEYKWAGPYMISQQVVAVSPDSNIYTLQDLAGKNIAVQATMKLLFYNICPIIMWNTAFWINRFLLSDWVWLSLLMIPVGLTKSCLIL